MSKKRKRKIHIRKKTISTIVGIVVLMMSIGFAWFYYSDRITENAPIDITTSYSLYLLNADASDYMQLTVSNLHPGESKQIIFCVSSKKPAGSGDDTGDIQVNKKSTFDYNIELAYTQNIPVNYKIYSLKEAESGDTDVIVSKNADNTFTRWKKDGSALTSDDSVTQDRRTKMYGDNTDGIVNKGMYEIYDKDFYNEPLQLKTADENQFTNDYYLMEINWNDEIIDFSKYSKETDLFYMIVKALQPKPEEQ